MKMLSVNIGLPREVLWYAQPVTTGIFKYPVEGPVALRKLNLDGDRQADLTVHGGEHKAVYIYPNEHYAYWKKKLPNRDLPPGSFGENFTTEGLLETEIRIGDRFAITRTGSAGLPRASRDDVRGIPGGPTEVIVTQPRLPCYKLGIRFESDDMVKKFLASRRVGFYVAVTKEGQVQADDEIQLLSRDPNAISIANLLDLYVSKTWTPADVTQIRRLFELPSLPDDWKSYFDHRLQQTSS
jgi:MOSC domain-containing protein YiiM